jgi:hypothetical protein
MHFRRKYPFTGILPLPTALEASRIGGEVIIEDYNTIDEKKPYFNLT